MILIYRCIFPYLIFRQSHSCGSSGMLGRSACNVDSGGPLVRELPSGPEYYEVAGIFSTNCSSILYLISGLNPLPFTRVDREVNTWIRMEVGERELPRRPVPYDEET